MKSKANKINAILCALVLVWLIYICGKLPDVIPVHWGLDGQADGWGSKYFIFFTWGITVRCNVLFDAVRKIDPKHANYDRFERPWEIFKVVFTVFMLALTVVTTLATFYPQLDIRAFVCAGMGILFAVIGNYMPKYRHNYTMGIRTPWTLASESVWNKTHRMAGPVWVAGGIAVVAAAFITKGLRMFAFILAVTFAIAIIPMVYSYLEYKKEENEKSEK